MIINGEIDGEQIKLLGLTSKYVSDKYVNWLNESKINQFLESRYEKITLEDEYKYVNDISTSNNQYLLAIIAKDKNEFIGNVHLTLNLRHKRCFIAYMIGETSYWGRGIATEAIKLVTKWCFDNLDIARMDGGVYSNNIGSLKAVLKAGWKQEGKRPGYCLCDDGTRVDAILVGLTREDFNSIEFYK